MKFHRSMLAGLCAAGLGIGTGVARAEALAIENSLLTLRADPGSGTFTLTDKASQRLFLTEGKALGQGGRAAVVSVADKTFGRGRGIEMRDASGSGSVVMLFPGLPFALLRASLLSGPGTSLVTNHVRTFSAQIDAGVPADHLKTLGTGGLLAPDKNPGSYVWLAVADPASRHGVVCGWVTHDRGSGVVFSRVSGGAVRLEAQLDYGRLPVGPDRPETLETLAIGWFDDARLGLEAWASAVARVYDIKLKPQPSGYCTWYSNPHGGASDEKHVAELSGFAATNLAPYGFSVVQIDDGWQAGISKNGPKRNFTTHAPQGRYASGMKAIADKIRADGLVPGIWFMPFAGTSYDPLFEPHRDWFVQRTNGAPYETDWGGTCLDMTHPGARAYLAQNVRRIAHEWGYGYFKMDGLWTGTATKQQYVNTGYKDEGIGDAVFHDPRKTNIEAYRDGLKLVRTAAGRRIFFLGCCIPQNMRSYGGAFGLVDAMRIGSDNGPDWDSLMTGPIFGSRHYFLHGRVWHNDPDPVYARPSLAREQAELICSWVALSGQLNISSEWLPGLPPDRLAILQRSLPSHGLLPRPVDLFENDPPALWLLTDERDPRSTPRRDVVGLFNWSNQEQKFDTALGRIGLDASRDYVGFDFWKNQPVDPLRGRLQITVPPRSCRILAVRPQLSRPQVVSTSRHVTQGIVDLPVERWDDATHTLSGRSRVVVGDPCELRVACGVTAWKAGPVEVSRADRKAGVQASGRQEAGWLRATLSSSASREVAWSVTFSPPSP